MMHQTELNALEYPKTENLFKRNETNTALVTRELRMTEFGMIKEWLLLEKVDGTNIRVVFDIDGILHFGGRTARAQLHTDLVKHLESVFDPYLMDDVFMESRGSRIILFGEGYGAGIQKIGTRYGPDKRFILFDIAIQNEDKTWWLDWVDVVAIAGRLGVPTVPVVGEGTIENAIEWLKDYSGLSTLTTESTQMEGLVARTSPYLFTKTGRLLKWKLKSSDLGIE